MEKGTNNPRQWQSMPGTGTAALGAWSCIRGELRPHDLSSRACSAAAVWACVPPGCPGSSFLLFALITPYNPFCGRTGLESTVCMVESIHNASRHSLNGSFNKGVGRFCVFVGWLWLLLFRYKPTFFKNWNRSPLHTVQWIGRFLMG